MLCSVDARFRIACFDVTFLNEQFRHLLPYWERNTKNRSLAKTGMNTFENSEVIQWDKREVSMTSEKSILGAVPYANPPRGFSLRGVRYNYCSHDRCYKGGVNDGVVFHAATKEGDENHLIWVSEQIPGEFIEVFIPASMADADFIVPKG